MKTAVSILLAGLVAGAVITGCGESGGPDPKVEAKRVEDLSGMRTLFNKANGNYESLSEADKAEFVKLCGGDQNKALTTWNAMKFGPGGPPQGQ